MAAAGAAIVVGALTTVSLTGAADREAPPAASSGLVEVTGEEQVGYDAGLVSTPCFSFELPDVGAAWMLVAGTRGCAASFLPRGGDMLTQFHVRGRPGEGAAGDLLSDAVDRARDAGDPVDSAHVAMIGGRDVAVMVQTTADGLRVATYLVPIPAVATHDGAAIGVVDIGSLVGAWHDDVVARIIGSLLAGTGATDVGGDS
ncbi:MAG: hypothetical protein J0I43_02665 [Microbacterium sp.]|uniref:hypothetical protein n=1 Tax=Microbacterium sp. TaxID=51671 RepID=UPI001AD3659F|nr:hypothetical protein [Microbacterium sp.]MBN9176259.1 hypothetical protein [Microbacterium sp.]